MGRDDGCPETGGGARVLWRRGVVSDTRPRGVGPRQSDRRRRPMRRPAMWALTTPEHTEDAITEGLARAEKVAYRPGYLRWYRSRIGSKSLRRATAPRSDPKDRCRIGGSPRVIVTKGTPGDWGDGIGRPRALTRDTADARAGTCGSTSTRARDARDAGATERSRPFARRSLPGSPMASCCGSPTGHAGSWASRCRRTER